MSADDRTAGTLLFDVEDRDVKAGEEVVVNFKATEKVTGYQFTMNFAGLEVVDVTPGADMSLANFGVFADAITTSFDADVTGEFAVKFRATQAGKLSSMLGVSSRVTKAEAYSKGGDRLDVAFRFLLERRPFDPFQQFRGSMPSLNVPLSTLRRGPCEPPPMTRGRSGSLLLLRMALSSTTPRRFHRRTARC